MSSASTVKSVATSSDSSVGLLVRTQSGRVQRGEIEFTEQVLEPLEQDEPPKHNEASKQIKPEACVDLELPNQHCGCYEVEDETASESDSVYSWDRNTCWAHLFSKPYKLPKKIRSRRSKRPRKNPMGPKLEWELIHPHGMLRSLQCCKFCLAVFPDTFYYAERARFIEDFPEMPEDRYPAKEPPYQRMSLKFAREQFPPFEPCVRSYKDPRNCTTCGCWFGRTPQGCIAAAEQPQKIQHEPPPHDGPCDGGWSCLCSLWYPGRDQQNQYHCDSEDDMINSSHGDFDKFFNERWAPESKIPYKEENYESYMRWLLEQDDQCDCSWCRPGLYDAYEYLMDRSFFPWLGYRYIAYDDYRYTFKSLSTRVIDEDEVRTFTLKDLRRESDAVAKKREREHMQKYNASRNGRTGVKRLRWEDTVEDIGKHYSRPLSTGLPEYYIPVKEQPKRSYRRVSNMRKNFRQGELKEVVQMPTRSVNYKEKKRKLVDYCRSNKLGICCPGCSRKRKEWWDHDDRKLWRITWELETENWEDYEEGLPGSWIAEMEEPYDYMGCLDIPCPICDYVPTVESTPNGTVAASVVGKDSEKDNSVAGDFEVLESLDGDWEEIEVDDENSSTFSWPSSSSSSSEDDKADLEQEDEFENIFRLDVATRWALLNPWVTLVDRAIKEFERKQRKVKAHKK